MGLLAVRTNGKLLCHATEALQKDRQLVNAAVKTDSSALFLYPHERWDAELVLAAIPANTKGYSFTSFMGNKKVKQVFDQRHFVMDAIEKDPMILQFASQNLKADKELVLKAVKFSWRALQHASDKLKSDQDIVNAALAQSPRALQFVAESMKNNRDLVLEVVKRDPHSLGYASKKLQA